MTMDAGLALELRRQIVAVYSAPEPPPGGHRATWIVTALLREPASEAFHAMGRDLLAVLALRARLLVARHDAVDPARRLLMAGLIGHADAALLGATRTPGWRALALDLLEADEPTRAVLDPIEAARLFTLFMADARG